jgi:hypothetical protein
MWEMDPQEIPEGLEAGIFTALGASMPWLVQDGRRGESQEALRTWVSGAVPAGAVRDCLHAGLWLLEGELDKAHRLCQEVPTVLGSAWHAVVHRQEGDFWNSKYWWRRVGAGGVKWSRLAGELRGIVRAAPGSVVEPLERLARSYDPARFVDVVEVHRENREAREVLLAVQRWEWAVLFIETWEGRKGGLDMSMRWSLLFLLSVMHVRP